MALKNQSLILYGYSVDDTNQFIDFQIVSMGPILTATIPQQAYNLSDYLNAIAAALAAADPSNTYTVTADRTIAGGTQNRITVTTSGSFLSILFNSGTHAAASAAEMMGFNAVDYTGATTYTGAATTGIAVIPIYTGYNWVAPGRWKKAFGNVNVSAAGVKEAIVFQLQRFFSVEFQHEPESIVDSVWTPWLDWACQQQEFEFTPDITQPGTFYPATLEETEEDGQALEYMMKEMLPEKPFLYRTGKLKFRQIIVPSEFI